MQIGILYGHHPKVPTECESFEIYHRNFKIICGNFFGNTFSNFISHNQSAVE